MSLKYMERRVFDKIDQFLALRSMKPFEGARKNSVFSPAARLDRRDWADVLKRCGDTYPGMPTKDCLKILAHHEFERVISFRTILGHLYLFGRRKEGILVTVDDVGGYAANISLQFVVFRDTEGMMAQNDGPSTFYAGPSGDGSIGAVGRVISGDALTLWLDGVCGRLAFAPLWPCAAGMQLATTLKAGFYQTPRGIASISDYRDYFFTKDPEERVQRITGEWRDILDIDRRRTAGEAYAAVEGAR